MKPPPKSGYPGEVRDILRQILDSEAVSIKTEDHGDPSGADFIVRVADLCFACATRASGDAAAVGSAIRQVAESGGNASKTLPLVIVPYMGQVGRDLCEKAGINWLDLSGNALLKSGSWLRIHVLGQPNRFKTRGRPQNLFAPKSARITRCLLASPRRDFTQSELAREAGLDEGFTSRIVHGLEEKELIQRDASGLLRPANPDLLLKSWREAYDFDQHRIIRGHMPVRSGTELLKRAANIFREGQLKYAATGMAGAWLIQPAASFRLTLFYVAKEPEASTLSKMSFGEQTTGANLWLVLPKDEGVFYGTTERNQIQCAHPVQVYLDLKNHPERSHEAAEAILPNLFEPSQVHE